MVELAQGSNNIPPRCINQVIAMFCSKLRLPQDYGRGKEETPSYKEFYLAVISLFSLATVISSIRTRFRDSTLTQMTSAVPASWPDIRFWIRYINLRCTENYQKYMREYQENSTGHHSRLSHPESIISKPLEALIRSNIRSLKDLVIYDTDILKLVSRLWARQNDDFLATDTTDMTTRLSNCPPYLSNVLAEILSEDGHGFNFNKFLEYAGRDADFVAESIIIRLRLAVEVGQPATEDIAIYSRLLHSMAFSSNSSSDMRCIILGGDAIELAMKAMSKLPSMMFCLGEISDAVAHAHTACANLTAFLKGVVQYAPSPSWATKLIRSDLINALTRCLVIGNEYGLDFHQYVKNANEFLTTLMPTQLSSGGVRRALIDAFRKEDIQLSRLQSVPDDATKNIVALRNLVVERYISKKLYLKMMSRGAKCDAVSS